MRDIRFRVSSAVILSIAAFLSLAGALAALLWWLIFTSRFTRLPKMSIIAGSAAMIGIIALLLQLLEGTGMSYGIRMGAILLIALWVFSEQQPGEYLALGVWLFGCRYGFELGLLAELGMQAFEDLLCDLERLQTAWAMKGTPLSIAHLPVAGLVLVRGALMRAQDTAELLAMRGYQCGGRFCPVFRPDASDIFGCATAAIILSGMIIPVGEFFILPW